MMRDASRLRAPGKATVGRGSIEKLAVNLGKAGVKVERQSKLLPDFVASSRLYMRMLMSFLAASFLRARFL
jgi:amidase